MQELIVSILSVIIFVALLLGFIIFSIKIFGE